MKTLLKFSLVLSIIFLASCSSSGNDSILTSEDERSLFSDDLLAVELNGVWGYIDEDGEVAIELEYDAAGAFYQKLAIVVKDNDFALIDNKGRVQTNWYSLLYRDMHNGMIWFIEDDLLGLMDEEGEIIVEPTYENFESNSYGEYYLETEFSDGLAKVTKNGERGFIDHKGAFKIPLGEGNDMGDFHYGLAYYWNREDGLYGYKDKTGEIVIDIQFKNAGNFNHLNQAIVEVESEHGYIHDKIVINDKGETIIDASDNISLVVDAYRVTTEDGVYFADEKGNAHHETLFNSVSTFGWWSSDPVFTADGKVINQYGQVLHDDSEVVDDYFIVDEKTAIIVRDEAELTILFDGASFTFEGDYIYDMTEDFVAIERGGVVGVVDYDGDEIIPFEYYGIGISEDGFMIIMDEDYRFGLATHKGDIIFEPLYDDANISLNP